MDSSMSDEAKKEKNKLIFHELTQGEFDPYHGLEDSQLTG